MAADGYKSKPMVIGRAHNPRCFANINKDNLPVIYFVNATAWVTKDVMNEWFYNHFVPEMKTQYGNRKVILIFIFIDIKTLQNTKKV